MPVSFHKQKLFLVASVLFKYLTVKLKTLVGSLLLVFDRGELSLSKEQSRSDIIKPVGSAIVMNGL